MTAIKRCKEQRGRYWVCASDMQDSPNEFVIESEGQPSDYHVCSGPYTSEGEALFWRYGGPHVKIQLLDLSEQEIDWMLGKPDWLSSEEKLYLEGLKEN